jgi:Protein of unknown function (DUF998)
MKSMNRINLANWSLWTSFGFISILTLLHFIKPEIEPSWNFISEYQVGRFGWLMQLAFFSLALSCIFIVLALWKKINTIGKIGLIMLIISAAGMIIASIFKTDALNTKPELVTQSGKLHQLGAMLDQIPFATIFITISLFRKKDWHINRLLLILTLILVWFGFIYFVGSIKTQFPADGKFGPNVLVGWQNRIMIITQAIWLAMLAIVARLEYQKTTNR